MKRMWQLASLCGALLVLWGITSGNGIREYVNEVKQGGSLLQTFGSAEQGAIPVFAAMEPTAAGSLLDRIQREADKRRIAPVDARNDPVWKAIPGYNGLEVDVEMTYKLAKARGGAEIPFVYRQVPPKVTLSDLGAIPVFKGNANKPMAALMINVAWGEEFLPKMLEILNNEKVRATFFFDGSWLNKHMELAQSIGAAGHELSNHAYTHPNMSTLGPERARSEITKTEDLLVRLGVKNKLFAPPSGDYNAQTVRIAHELGLTTVLWTIDTIDWKNPSPSTVLSRVTRRLEPGALILMHPTKASSESLEAMIQTIERKGLVLGTVSEMLSEERVPQSQGSAPPSP